MLIAAAAKANEASTKPAVSRAFKLVHSRCPRLLLPSGVAAVVCAAAVGRLWRGSLGCCASWCHPKSKRTGCHQHSRQVGLYASCAAHPACADAGTSRLDLSRCWRYCCCWCTAVAPAPMPFKSGVQSRHSKLRAAQEAQRPPCLLCK